MLLYDKSDVCFVSFLLQRLNTVVLVNKPILKLSFVQLQNDFNEYVPINVDHVIITMVVQNCVVSTADWVFVIFGPLHCD